MCRCFTVTCVCCCTRKCFCIHRWLIQISHRAENTFKSQTVLFKSLTAWCQWSEFKLVFFLLLTEPSGFLVAIVISTSCGLVCAVVCALLCFFLSLSPAVMKAGFVPVCTHVSAQRACACSPRSDSVSVCVRVRARVLDASFPSSAVCNSHPLAPALSRLYSPQSSLCHS